MACSIYDPSAFGLGELSYFGILLSILIVAITYMFGKLIKREYEELAKLEMFNSIMSSLLLILSVSLVGLSNVIACQLYWMPIIDGAVNQIYKVIYTESYPMLETMMIASATGSALESLTLDMKSITVQPLAGLNAFISSLNIASAILETTFASLYTQALLLLLYKEIAFTIFLPLGLALRSFPKLRDPGNFIISLTFTLYLIYPFLIYYSYNVYDTDIKNSVEYDQYVREVYQQTQAKNWIDYGKSLGAWIMRNIDSLNIYNIGIAGLTVFKYKTLQGLIFGMGRVLFLTVAIPSLAIIISVSTGMAVTRFLKEVTPA